jgi:hypothetical protein
MKHIERLTVLPYVQATDNALVVAFVTNLEKEKYSIS